MTATRVRLIVSGWLEGLVRADLVYATGHADPLPPVPLTVALVESGGRRILFDAGATPERAERKGVTGYVGTPELLPRLGVAADEIDDLVISHLHWDHASQAPAFQHARRWVHGGGSRPSCSTRWRLGPSW